MKKKAKTKAKARARAKAKAKELAKEKGLDLIEIAGNVNPPVAKIISFDKFRYQEEKKFKKIIKKIILFIQIGLI